MQKRMVEQLSVGKYIHINACVYVYVHKYNSPLTQVRQLAFIQ